MTNDVQEKSQDSRSSVASNLVQPVFSATSDFKYYIHDTADGYRLQMSGNLTDHQVSELNCCWMTARNTLRNRKLILDMRGIKHVDERGMQWLAGMALEGASYVPETFLRDKLAGGPVIRKNTMRFGFIERILSAFRGCPASAE